MLEEGVDDPCRSLMKLNLANSHFVDAHTGETVSVREIEGGLVRGRIYPGAVSPLGIIDTFARSHRPSRADAYLALSQIQFDDKDGRRILENGYSEIFLIQYYKINGEP